MLTVYSTHGSPGASTTAVYLAAQWASSGHQVLLIETDAAAGSLSQKLGIQFTPGTASFIAAGKPVTSASLIEHAQDVLFNDFHIMPTPSSPSGARTVAEKFARLGEELRDISEREMAIIVDGGRLTADARTSELTTSAAAVLIVARDENQLPSLEHVSDALVHDASQPGPLGLVATVGPNPLSEADWRSNHGLVLIGSVDLSTGRGTDLSMFMSRGKRKSRKLRGSLEKLADSLYEFACPASAATPRARLPANRLADDTSPADAEETLPGTQPNDLLAGIPTSFAPAPTPPPQPDAPVYDQYGQPMPTPVAYEPQPMQPDYQQSPFPQQGYPDSGYAVPGHHDPQYRDPPPRHEPPAYDYGGAGAAPYGQPVQAEPQPLQHAAETPPMPPVEAPTVPTGSFRTWAAHLFGESAGDDPDENWPRPGTGATA